jgi:hypothetical protein
LFLSPKSSAERSRLRTSRISYAFRSLLPDLVRFAYVPSSALVNSTKPVSEGDSDIYASYSGLGHDGQDHVLVLEFLDGPTSNKELKKHVGSLSHFATHNYSPDFLQLG